MAGYDKYFRTLIGYNISVKTVIFDFDGTLANTIPVALSIYNELAPKMGSLPISADEFPRLRKMGYKQIIREKRLNWFRLPWLMRIVPRKMLQQVGEIEPYPGVSALIQKLLLNGYQVGVLSSNAPELLNAFFHTHQFPPFSFIVSERSLFGKDKAIRKIMKKYGLNARDVTYVGDEPRDVYASRKAGINVIGVTWGLGGVDGFEQAKPDAYAHTAAELEKLLG